MSLDISAIIFIVIGLALIFVASKLVGFAIKIVGLLFLGYGGVMYLLTKELALRETIFPVIAGLALLLVGKRMAETVIRIVGILIVLWGILGIIL